MGNHRSRPGTSETSWAVAHQSPLCMGFFQQEYWSGFSSVTQLVRLFSTPCTAVCQASLSITNSRSSPKPISIELVMPSNYLILCCPLLLLPSIFPSIQVFSNESALCIRCWSLLQGIFPSQELKDTCHIAGRVFTV